MSRWRREQKGQGSVEYVLLLLSIVVIMWSVFDKLKVYFAGEAKNCNSSSASFICTLKKSISPNSSRPFRYYTLR